MTGKVLVVFGTRPEAIKLAPVVQALRRKFQVRLCVTAQQRQMLDQVLQLFGLQPEHDLNIMRVDQDLFDITTRALEGLRPVIAAEEPGLVLVQGDTTTTLAAALAAAYLQIPVGHVEAGLRTGDKSKPFPEEINRRLTSHVADWHFAPTASARANLLEEGVPAARIFVTGNPGIDALLSTVRRIEDGTLPVQLPATLTAALDGRKMILVTVHRRESFGSGFESICRALHQLAKRHPDVAIIYPVHLNPKIREPALQHLRQAPEIYMTEPLDYPPFVELMRRAYLIVTDSGGIQEEASSLGKPVLVMRDATERPEGLEAGVARLVGTDTKRIVEAVEELLTDERAYQLMARQHHLYGDGQASERIAAILAEAVNVAGF